MLAMLEMRTRVPGGGKVPMYYVQPKREAVVSGKVKRVIVTQNEEAERKVQEILSKLARNEELERRAEMLAEMELLQAQIALIYRDEINRRIEAQEQEIANIMMLLFLEV